MRRITIFNLVGMTGVLAAAVALGIAIEQGGIDWRRGGETVVGAPPAAHPTATGKPGVLAEKPPAAPAQKGAAGKPVPPSFDAVRVGPDGRAVVAGRAAPGAAVTLLDRGQVIGRATADDNGEWVIIPDKPLAPGAGALSLEAQSPGQTPPERSTATVAVIVPAAPAAVPAAAAPALAVLLPEGAEGAARALQPGGGDHRLALDIVEYDATSHVDLSGRAAPGAKIAVSINDRRAGKTAADAQGSWAIVLGSEVPFGRYRLQLDAVSAAGRPAGRVSLALRRPAPGEVAAGDYIAVVPGNNLWHVAQHSYGSGLRYLEIFRANERRIEDPNLIYPGQLLAVPAGR
mgnify:CR=1 FL=1